MHRDHAGAIRGPWFRILMVALFLFAGSTAHAALLGESGSDEPKDFLKKSASRSTSAGVSGQTNNASCAGPACDTLWVGHSNSGPGGAFLGVGVGGVWDFDTGIAGTDSTQGFHRWPVRMHFTASRPANTRLEWAPDYGNQVNVGNTNLWAARDLAGRKYVKTGIAGVWHSDNMSGVKYNVANGAEPSATALSGTRSAWCGLREAGNTQAQDALTGNYINGDLITDWGGAYATGLIPEYPGYCNQWDQMLYKDFTAASSGTLSFKVKTEMFDFVDPTVNGSGWFNPDPTSTANFVNNPSDSFMVYIGSPKDVAYDTNRRWFSEVLDFSKPVQELFSVSGVFPFVASDTSITRNYAGLSPTGGKVRLVFRVKTNRIRSDQTTSTPTGTNTKTGAAMVDDVQLNGGTVYGFETAGSVTARSLIPDISANGGAWATTGKPPSSYFHIENIASLIYEDLCGTVGAPSRQCDMVGNVLVAGDADNGNLIAIESWQTFESPTIDLAVRNAAPGTKNSQGIDREMARRTAIAVDYDWYSGFMSLDESVFWFISARAWDPSVFAQPISNTPIWSPWIFPNSLGFNGDPQCDDDQWNISGIGFNTGAVDSLRIQVNTQTNGWRFGGTNLGNTRGTYFDRIRVGFARGAQPLSWNIWDHFQDQFPFNDGVSPGDNAAFDTTTALIRTSNNIVAPTADPGVVPGDTLVVNAPFTGDGVATGTRVDLIFRIDPGPGNYTIKGDRTSALVNKDPGHPFFASYLANNGQFGTPGGHGGTWNRNVWNSARMDTADTNIFPIVARGIGDIAADQWQSTLHESDPRFAALGIDHNMCFLVNPDGAGDQTNIDCSGTVPPVYGAVPGTTKEGTKILPDGWFTPGTHIEYFLRRSSIENPTAFNMLMDTTTVFEQDISGQRYSDAERWSNVDVLPDMWKSSRYNGGGLACVLLVDGQDRRGSDRDFRGAADTLGYGKNNGASQGWKGLGPAATSEAQANNPAGYVAANNGQYGLSFDHYDINGSESSQAGHLGVRFAQNVGLIANKGDKSGPTASQLATLYGSVFYSAADLDDDQGTLHDAVTSGQGANDIALLEGFLNGATASSRKSIWLSGEGFLQDAVNRNTSDLYDFLTDTFGADFVQPNVKIYTNTQRSTIALIPTAPWAHPGRIYGFDHRCIIAADIIAPIPTVDGASVAAEYEHIGPGPYVASVYRPLSPGSREYRTLIDGFDLDNVRGHYADVASVQTKPENDNGRLAWFDDVWNGLFALCARRGPVISVGDRPGSDGSQFVNANLGAFPNPALAHQRITMRFSLAKAQDVTVRIYSIAGREVAQFGHRALAGPNTVTWDGSLSSGAKAASGVYFYRIDGPDGIGVGGAQKMVLLSQN